VAEGITGRLELRPASNHLVVGGIGSGKTTQLLLVERALKQLPDTLVKYLDVSQFHNLALLREEVLIVLVVVQHRY
jgi:energy-coupling factor transporter ATP-binding protein EcfA2